jgi:hypothetical protein
MLDTVVLWAGTAQHSTAQHTTPHRVALPQPPPKVSLSHEVMPMVKMVPRGFTAAADAYLTPHIMR